MAPALILFAVGFLGALLGVTSNAALWPLMVLLGVSSAFYMRFKVTFSPFLRAFGLLGICFGATFISGRAQVESHKQKIEALPFQKMVVLQGIAVDVAPSQNGKIRVDLAVEQIWQGSQVFSGGQKIRLQLSSAALLLPVDAGDRLRVRGILKPLKPALSPGAFNAALYGLSRGLHGRLNIRAQEQMACIQNNAEFAIFAALRNRLRTKLYSQVSEREAGVVLALLVGDTATFDDEQNMIYRRVGAGHLLAVSGLQVTLVAVLVFQLMTWILAAIPWTGRRNRVCFGAALSSLLSVWGFVGLCGAPPSCVRAAAMATAGIVALFLGRKAKGVEAFGAAGLLTVLLSPLSVIDPSFLLSYAAVLGLLIAQVPTTPPAEDSAAARFIWRQAQLVALLLSAGAAGVLTLPISAALFSEISPGGLLANIILVPAAATLQIPSLFLGLLGAIFDQPFLTYLGAQAAGILEALTEGCGTYVGGLISVPPPNAAQTFLFTLAGSFWVQILRPHTAHKRALLGLSLLSCALAFAPLLFQPNGICISVLPVGQGDGAVMQLPDGTVFVVDGGGVWDEHLHPGRDVMVPFLKRKRIQKIDVMVLSHPHPDHLLGLLDILEIIEVKELWHSGYDQNDMLMARLLASAEKHHVRVRRSKELIGSHFYGESKIQVFTPMPEDGSLLYEELSVNDNSLTLRFSFGETSALWPGDLEFWGEHYLLRDHRESIISTVLKAPHHGSKTSSSLPFLKAVSPQWVIFPTGLHNQWGFPHAPVVNRYKKLGIHSLDTAQHGEITLWLTGKKLEIQTFRNPADD